MKNFSPAVSVIIPVYNAEKYFGVCLESILNQTFTDFELLVVDDCSTDSSYAIAESYLERFGGRLKIISLPENTGSGAVPRNVGLDLSQGKYVFLMDNDDLIVDNALEIFYKFAQEYQADVVYADRGFRCGTEIFPQNLTEVLWNPLEFASSTPTLETNDIGNRVEKFLQKSYSWTPWSKLVHRDLLVDNKIFFPRMTISDDFLWTFKFICLTKNFLRVPLPIYIYRTNAGSILHRNRTPQDEIKFWLSPLLTGIDCLDEFMNGFELFNRADNLRLRVLNFFAKIHLDFMAEAFKTLERHEVYKIFVEEISKSSGDHTALISYLLLMTNIYRSELTK